MLKKDLKTEIKILNMQLDQALKDYEEEADKVAKAIVYIENTPLQKGTEYYRIQLLEILQGSDKE